jgi:hypothetical protein
MLAYYCAVAGNLFLTLLTQALLALPLVLPILFALVFGSVYFVLLLVNAGFALVNGYRRRPPRLLVPIRVMVAIALVVAALVCVGFLASMDSRYT